MKQQAIFAFLSVSIFLCALKPLLSHAQTDRLITSYLVTTEGFSSGYSASKTDDIEGVGTVFRVRTDSADENVLFLNGDNLAVNIDESLTGITEIILDFTRDEVFDVKSLKMVSDEDRNYVFTPDVGDPITLPISKLEFNTQVLDFKNISSLRIRREDNLAIQAIFFDDILLENIQITIDSDGGLASADEVEEPVAIGLSNNDSSAAIDILDFVISDGGTLDNKPLLVESLKLTISGTATKVEKEAIVWRLSVNDEDGLPTVYIPGTYDAASSTVQFLDLSLSIADGESRSYKINTYLNEIANIVPGHTLVVSIDGDTDLSLNANGSQMGDIVPVNNGTGSVLIDDIPASVLSVSSSASGVLTEAKKLTFVVNTNEDVFVSGHPRLAITVGAENVFAQYISGSGSQALSFEYTIEKGDSADDIVLQNAIDINGGSLQDASGNNLFPSLNNIDDLSGITVDALVPSITELSAVMTPSNDTSPSVTLTLSEPGILTLEGPCSSAEQGAVAAGNTLLNLVQANSMSFFMDGVYSECTALLTDAAGNISEPLVLSAFEIDTTPPALQIIGPDVSETSVGPVHFLVRYSGASVIGLSAADINLFGTGSANASVSISGTGLVERQITLNNIVGDGTLNLSIGVHTASDAAGNFALESAMSASVLVISDTTNALSVVTEFANDPAGPPPTLDDYDTLGLDGVTSNNIDFLNREIGLLSGSDVDDVLKIQAVLASVLARLEVLEDSRAPQGSENANGVLISFVELQDILDLDALDSSLERAYQNEITIADIFDLPPSLEQVQALIDSVNVLSEVLEDSGSAGGTSNANGELVTYKQLLQIQGIAALNETYLVDYQTAINLAADLSNLPTLPEVQSLIDQVNMSFEDEDGDGVLNRSDLCAGTTMNVEVDNTGCEVVVIAPPTTQPPPKSKKSGGAMNWLAWLSIGFFWVAQLGWGQCRGGRRTVN